MVFEANLGKHLMIAASAKMAQLSKRTADVWCPRDYCTADNPRGLDTNMLLNKV